MAYTGVVDFDPDLMGLGRGDLDILDAELLAGFPGDSCLAGDGLRARYVSLSSARKWMAGTSLEL